MCIEHRPVDKVSVAFAVLRQVRKIFRRVVMPDVRELDEWFCRDHSRGNFQCIAQSAIRVRQARKRDRDARCRAYR